MEPAHTLQLRSHSAPVSFNLAFTVATVLLVLGCALPVLTAPRARLTSDESLYVSEALNIYQGRGPEYTTRRPVVHRAPLYPALLALEFEVGGPSLDGASYVPRVATVLNALLLVLFARMLAGPVAGCVAGVAAASSAYLNGLGASLFLDSVESTFVLVALVLLWLSQARSSSRLALGAGISLGLAFLVKESAVLFLPLPLVFALVAGAGPGWRARFAAWLAGFGLATAGWWLWVLLRSGDVFLLGDPGARPVQVALVLSGAAAATLSLALWRFGGRLPARAASGPALAGAVLLLAWGGAALAGLEWRAWDHPRDYLSDVPAYVAGVFAPAVPSLPLMAAAAFWAFARALRGERAPAFLLVTAGLYLPFVIAIANRDLSLRDTLPLIYVGMALMGCAAAWLVGWGAALARRQGSPPLEYAGFVVVAAAAGALTLQGLGRVERSPAYALQDDWDNQVAADTAAWLRANVPPGTPILSTRLYFSQVYFLTDGAYPVHQMPTVLIDARPGRDPALEARGTLFRWEALPDRARDHWLYLTRFGDKSYYIGLAEEDLLADLVSRGIGYVVLNWADDGFSSAAFLPYFEGNPAFQRVYDKAYGPSDRTVIFKVDPAQLAPRPSPLRVTASAWAGLLQRAGGDPVRLQASLETANPAGIVSEK
jgi:4-amino-4-deoxy-L-arabinose transferase-like glycosyltransferase